MSGNEALKRMKEIQLSDDIEARHAKADDLLCEILLECGGYEEVVEFFQRMCKWYG